ncbi:MAG: hypothetical protein E7436_03880 [Ruminococcaceae bacterium]|nr:hypothetical protein [Oscillospiraceae bacterium]
MAEYELLQDRHFRGGFTVLNMGGAEKDSTITGVFSCTNPGERPIWRVAQWETRFDFRDPAQTVRSCPEPGVFRFDSGDKVFEVDTTGAVLSMELNASRVWGSPRQEGQGWPHLLIEGPTVCPQAPFANRLGTATALRLSFAQRLTMFRDHMGPDADPNLHTGSFYIYLYIKGQNNKGETEMTWFGLTLFDNRFHFDEERGSRDAGKTDASGLFIYQVPIRAFRQVPAAVSDDWLTVDIDVLPYIRRALELAQERGYMLGVRMEEVFIDGMNMGWEMPGTYDGCMQIRELSLKARFGGSKGGSQK